MSRTEVALYSTTRVLLKSATASRLGTLRAMRPEEADVPRRGEPWVEDSSAEVRFPRTLHDSTFRMDCPHSASGKAIRFRSG